MDKNEVSKISKEVKSEYRRNKILAISTLAVIFIIIGIGVYFYFQSGILPKTNETTENESPETSPETVSSGKPLPPLSEQPIKSGNTTEKSLPPLSESPERETSGEKSLPPLSE